MGMLAPLCSGPPAGALNTFYPRPPPCSSAFGCGATFPSFGPNDPNYVVWTADGRGLLALSGVYLKAPEHDYDDPDRIHVMRSSLSSSRPGEVLVRNATLPHMSPDGRFVVAAPIHRRKFGVFTRDGRAVRFLPDGFAVGAWAPTRR